MLVNLVGNLLSVLVLDAGFVGIALSTAVAAWVNVFLLYWTLHRRDHLRFDTRFKSKALRIGAASVAMGIALYLLNPLLDPYMARSTMERVLALVTLCGVGGAVYGAVAIAVGAFSLREIRTQFMRKG